MSATGRALELSRRLLSTFRINEEILQKFKSKGFNLKSEIECLSDSDLQSVCGLTADEIETINKEVKNSHNVVIEYMTCLELSRAVKEIIHTGCYSLDHVINGGVEVGKITQMSAPGGAGKTQICMQCCVNVQMPLTMGGLSSSALYIDTEKNLRTERLMAMAKHRLSTHPELKDLSVDKIISNIKIFECDSAQELVDLLVDKLEIFIDQNPNIKLVVIDSIAQHFRFDYKGTPKQREAQLSQIAIRLRHIAHYKKVAVLVANQVTHNPKTDRTEPSLGQHWQTYCNYSVFFRRVEPEEHQRRMGHIIPTNDIEEAIHFYFTIEKTGIKELMSGSKWHPDYE